MRSFTALWAVVVTTGFTLLTGITATSVEPDAPKIVSEGHIDVGPHFVDGKWTLQIRDISTTPYTYTTMDKIVVHANDTTKITVPSTPEYKFLGTAGDSTWVLPQTQKADSTWLGWQTQDDDVAKAMTKAAKWTVHDVKGPGKFALFVNGNFGKPDIIFDPAKSWPQSSTIEPGTHAHGNWAFSKEGTYVLDMEMSATGSDGKTLSGRAPLTVHVGAGVEQATAAPVPATEPSGNAEDGSTEQAAPASSGISSSWLIFGGVAVVILIIVAFFATRRGASRE